ncbi:LytTR family DNA-binding domain-containing protein [Polymorphobacter sp.]|uniref:LytTR family DNA-binding domain-containing protein n=1 Tax=Polymorphobacter sp. TaxID=1909290 RepID=UPI003F711EE5
MKAGGDLATRRMTPGQYAMLLLAPPLIMGFLAGVSQFGSVRFESRIVHVGFSLMSMLPNWLAMELGSAGAALALRPWRPPLWVVLLIGVLVATQLHAPFTILRDALFEPFLEPGSHFFRSWPWNYGNPVYALESLFAMLGRLAFWMPVNFLVVQLLGFQRFGYGDFFDRREVMISGPVSDTIHARLVEKAENGQAVRPSLSLLLRRLPERIGRDIICLKAQEHYTEVVTRGGSALVYMRFSDAMGVVASGIDGVQVHRSYWVAYAAIEGFERADGRIQMRLANGERLPVSRTYQNQVRTLKPA